MALQAKSVAILAEDDFEDSELLEPLKALRDAGLNVTIVGSGTKETFRGKKGATIHADISADQARGSDFDAVIVPGGYAPDKMRLHPAMIDLVRNAFNAGRIVAAVCHGPQLLISAGIVRARTATSWPSVAIDLKNAGANYVDQPVVVDGNLITSRMPADLPQFSAAIIGALSGKTSSRTTMRL